jgi:hypothetical protein
MPTTTLTQLDYKFREYLAKMEVAWAWPQMFMAPNGEKLQDLETWEAGSFDVQGYGKEKWYEWPIEWSAPYSITPGAIGDTSTPETGSHAKMYAKHTFAPVKLDSFLADYKNGDIQLGEAAMNELDYRVSLNLRQFQAHYQQVFWGDGTGRKARLYSMDDPDGTYTRIYLRPMWAQFAMPGALDATKHLVENMYVRIGTWDETAAAGVGSGAWTGTLNMRRIRQVHTGTTVCGGADAPYILVTPQIVDPGSDTTLYLFIEHPETGGTADKEVQGAMAWIGDGYNAHTDATTSVVGAGNNFPSFGRRMYANIDRFTDDAYRKFRGYIYNRYVANPFATVTLTAAIVDEWLRGYYNNAPGGTRLDCIVANSALRSRFSTAFAAQGSLFMNYTDFPAGKNTVGFRGAAIIDCYGGGGDRVIPVFFCDDAPRQSIWGFAWKSLKHAIVNPGEWAPGDSGKGPFRDMRNITSETLLQATYQRSEMFIQHQPAAQTALFFAAE